MAARLVVVCDILGTLFPLTPVGAFIHSLLSAQLLSTTPPHATTLLPSPILLAELLYAELLKHAASLSLAGRFTPVAQLLPAVVERVASTFLYKHCGGGADAAGIAASGAFDQPYRLSEADRQRLKQVVATLPPRQHATEFVQRLIAAGCSLVALSNGGVSTTAALLQHAGVEASFSAVLSAEAVAASKPDPRVYALVEAGGHFGGGGMVFVSVHAWDCAGVLSYNRLQQQKASEGGKAGRTYTVCYVSEEERRWLLDEGDRPAIEAIDLRDAAVQIERLARLSLSTIS